MSKSFRLFSALAVLAVARALPAQVASNADADRDSVEVAALRYSRSMLAGRKFVLEPRVRVAGKLVTSRSEAQVSRLLGALSARRGTLGCGRDVSACSKLSDEVGIILQAPTLKGDEATITIEQYFDSGNGSETYLVVRQGKGWTVSKVTSRSAS
jgi:hypothetical protein